MLINILERYVTIMYDRTRTCRKVTDAQRDIITRKGRYTVAVHPTSDALLRSPVERDTKQDATNMSKRENFDVSDDNDNLFRVYGVQSNGRYAFAAIYLFNFASARLHCHRNIRKFPREITRNDITTIFTISSMSLCP